MDVDADMHAFIHDETGPSSQTPQKGDALGFCAFEEEGASMQRTAATRAKISSFFFCPNLWKGRTLACVFALLFVFYFGLFVGTVAWLKAATARSGADALGKPFIEGGPD